MADKIILPSKDPIGRHATYFNKPAVTMPAGKYLVVGLEQNVQSTKGLNVGGTQISVGDGGDLNSYPDLSESQMAIFISQPSLYMDAVNGDVNQRPNTWDKPKAYFAVDLYVAARGRKFKGLVSTSESYGPAGFFAVDWHTCPTQADWVAERWAYWVNQLGGFYSNEYGGCIDCFNATNSPSRLQEWAPAQSNPDAALAVFKKYESSQTPFFNRKLYKLSNGLGMDFLIKVYYAAHMTPMQNLYAALIVMAAYKQAMKTAEVAGAIVKSIFFGMKEGMEFGGYTVVETMQVKGGTLTGTGFSHYSMVYKEYSRFLYLLYADVEWDWSDLLRWGTNPDIIGAQHSQYVYQGGGATTIPAIANYQPGGAGINVSPLGMNDGCYQGWKRYVDARNWVGSGNFIHVPFRRTNEGSYCSNNADYLVQRALEVNGCAWLMVGSTTRYFLLFIPPGMGDWAQWVIPIPGRAQPITTPLICGGFPFYLQIDTATA